MARAIIVAKDKQSSYLYKVALTFQKIEINVVSSVSEALRAVEKKLPDFVVFDLHEFEASELKKMEELIKKIENLPVIILGDMKNAELKQKAALLKTVKKLSADEGVLGELIKSVRKVLK